MKKITLIASLLVLFTACQKADIHPRSSSEAGCVEHTTPNMQRIQTNSNPDAGNANSLGSRPGSKPTIDPNSPTENPNEGEITDPLRKKDQKDNR